MAAVIVATLTYQGTLVTTQIDTSPWRFIGARFPDRGTVADKPQFVVDLLQPPNVDGSRVRIGGAHYPVFKMLTVCAATSFGVAKIKARQMALAKGDLAELSLTTLDLKYTVAILDVVSVPNAKRALGAVGDDFADLPAGGVSFQSEAKACVDTEWTLQVVNQ